MICVHNLVESAIRTFAMPTPTYTFPVNPEAGQAYWIPSTAFRSTDGSSTGDEVEHLLGDKVITAEKLAAKEYIGYEEEEDSIIPIVPIIRDAIARRMALESDRAVLRGEGAGNTALTDSPITGLTGLGIAADITLGSGAAGVPAVVDEDLFVDMRRDLGLWGLDPSRLILFVCHDLYYSMMKMDVFKTVDVIGVDRATLITGQVGSIFGIPVVVSQAFATPALTTEVAVLARPDNFIIGNLRGLMTENDRDIENQKNILVTSRRFAFSDIIITQGAINLILGT